MGAIDSDIPNLPGNADPDKVARVQAIYDSLIEAGLPVPPQTPAAITRAQLRAFMQLQVGEMLKTELNNDPIQVGYGAAVGVQAKADLLNNPVDARFVVADGAFAGGYVFAPASSTVLVVVGTQVGGGAANFHAFLPSNIGDEGGRQFYLRPRVGGSIDPLNTIRIFEAPGLGTTLRLFGQLPTVPLATDIFDVVEWLRPRPPRVNRLFRNYPNLPNVFTAADVAGALL